MSLTGTAGFFASVHEDGINDFINAYFGARPRYLKIGTPLFIPATTVDQTRIDPIDLAGGIHLMLQIGPPKLDLHPASAGFALPPDTNQFALEIQAELTVACVKREQPKPDGPVEFSSETTRIAVCAVGTIERSGNFLKFRIEKVEIKDIKPESLESVLECILLQVLQDALSGLCIPYQSVALEIGSVVPGPAPLLADDQVSLTATLV